ncbi:MAG: hypothetical protein ILP02_03705 [Clostridia bacterium]|nr:hypothetical protein [Clostridia bacterium]
MKEYYPDIVYNRGKRRLYVSLLALAVLLVGGVSAAFFVLEQTMIAVIVLVFLVVAIVTTLPSALMNYPVKNKPLIEIGDGKVRLYGKEEYKSGAVLVASVMIDVPPVKGTREDKLAHLNRVASTKPSEPVTGACDVLVKDEKGKETTKYNIVYDCMGALQDLLDIGVKQYRIIYSMKKLSVKAHYKVFPTAKKSEEKTETLSEKDKMMQLI